MNNTNAISATKQNNKLTKGCKFAKKSIMSVVTAAIMLTCCGMTAFAAGTGEVDSSTFITTACTVLKSVIILIGGGVGVWGIVNLLEGYGNDNPGAKAFIIESKRFIREVEILKFSGGLYTLRFPDSGGGIKLRENRLFATKEEAEQKSKMNH